ncbi:MAG: hypothetical protein AAF514_15705 [Verrucomicrobiota bacterium]
MCFFLLAALFSVSACREGPGRVERLVKGEVEPLAQFAFPREQIARGQGLLKAPGSGLQDYRIFVIDARKISRGMIRATLKMDPDAESAASMDLFDGNAIMPADPNEQEKLRRSRYRLASQYGNAGIKPGEQAVLEYPFDQGQVFQLGITGDWFSTAGTVAKFELQIEILE